jgi:hypothetical protein
VPCRAWGIGKSTASSATFPLPHTFVPSTPMGPRRFSDRRKNPERTSSTDHRHNCAVIERKESSVDFPCLFFHFFRLLLSLIQNLENPENAQIERLRDVRALCDQLNEQDMVRPAKGCDPGSYIRRVPIDKKDHGAF